MAVIRQRIRGTICGESDQVALLLGQGSSLYVSYALEIRGSGQLVLPELILDDWGHELSGLSIYSWIQENALQFPRAELFGLDLQGKPSQRFLRELEVTSLYPCFVFSKEETKVRDSILVDMIWFPKSGIVQSQEMEELDKMPFPLSKAKVSWWLVDPDTCAL